MFKSARLKLTLFYLAVLLAFSFTLTLSLRVLAEQEYRRSNDAQRSEVYHLFVKGVTIFKVPLPKTYDQFGNAQDDQAALVRRHLNQQFALINSIALVIGGLLSYWFAGRTLRREP
jgi:hypothetical protein